MGACWKCGAKPVQTFGELVKEWRGEKPLREVAPACGVSPSTLSRVESGELPDMRSFIAIVRATGVAVDFALGLIETQIEVEKAVKPVETVVGTPNEAAG